MAIAYSVDADHVTLPNTSTLVYGNDHPVPLAGDPPEYNFLLHESPDLKEWHLMIAHLIKALFRFIIIKLLAEVMLHGFHRSELIVRYILVLLFYRYYIYHQTA